MNTPFKGFETKEITLVAGDGLKAGQVVTLAEPCTANTAAQGEKFCGLCSNVRGDYASVVMKGWAKVKYSGNVLEVGYANLAADGLGGVKADTNGREYLVLAVDEDANTAEIFIN